MEAALRGAGNVALLRPGAIYGPGSRVREWFFVEKVLRGEKLDPLPRPQRPSDGQDQSGAAQPAEERPARESHAPRIKPSESPGIA